MPFCIVNNRSVPYNGRRVVRVTAAITAATQRADASHWSRQPTANSPVHRGPDNSL